MNQILLCSPILLLLFTVASCDSEQQLDSAMHLKSDSTKSASLKNVPPKNDETQAKIAKDDVALKDAKKGDYIMDIDISDLPLDDYPINRSKSLKSSSIDLNNIPFNKGLDDFPAKEKNQGSNQSALKALQQRLLTEQNNSLLLRNHSIYLMKEIEARKTDIIKVRQLNLDLELELNTVNRRLLELNGQLQNTRKSTKPCKKRSSKDSAPPAANQFQEANVRNTYRNKYLTLLKELSQKINNEIAKVATDVPTETNPSQGNLPTL
nr:Acp26Aa [Drosophila melanogaster]